MKTKITYLFTFFMLMLLGVSSFAQPDIDVTDVFIYETPISNPPTPVANDKVICSQVVAVGLTLENNGVDLLTNDTIRMGWSESPNGSLISVLNSDFTNGTSRNFIVIQSQTAPATAGKWKVCIWPTYTSKGFTNNDPMVGRSCKEVDVACVVGIDQYAIDINKAYFSGDQLMLNLSSAGSQNLEVRLFNLGGQEVYNGTVNKGINAETISISTGDLKRGMYIISIYTADGQVVNQKLVK